MDTTGKSRLSQFWNHLQHELFPFLREEDHLALSPALEQVIRVLEFTQIERFIPSSRGCVEPRRRIGVALARAFVAKAVLDLPTTEALIDRLQVDRSLRRICGFERVHAIPDASRFSRVFAGIHRLGVARAGPRGADPRPVGRSAHRAHRPGCDRDRSPGEARRPGSGGGHRTRGAFRGGHGGGCGVGGRRRAGTGAGQAARAPAQRRGTAQGADRH